MNTLEDLSGFDLIAPIFGRNILRFSEFVDNLAPCGKKIQ